MSVSVDVFVVVGYFGGGSEVVKDVSRSKVLLGGASVSAA